MATIERFEDMEMWKQARQLTNLIYDMSGKGAFARDFGLRDQMRRSAVSIMSNIAEGFESHTQQMFIRYLGIAKASAGELRSQLYIAVDQKYIDQKEFEVILSLAEQSGRQIEGFIRYLEKKPGLRSLHEHSVVYTFHD